MYTSYAAIYDLAGQGRFGEFMAQWAIHWFETRAERPRRVLDLACGTGAATLALARAGCSVVGIDQSAAMLAIGQGRARDEGLNITWHTGDIREADTVVRPGFDLVTCFTDSVNYLIGDDDLTRTFQAAAAVLRPGGFLVFDVNTEAEYATWDDRDVVAHDSADLMVYQLLRYNRRTRLGHGKIVWFVREIDRWWRDEETHIQRAWAETDIRTALAEAGFEIAYAGDAPGAVAGRRAVYIARRA